MFKKFWIKRRFKIKIILYLLLLFLKKEKLNINLYLNNESITVLLGNNGSGKSTLLKCIDYLLKFHKGRILLFGKIFLLYL